MFFRYRPFSFISKMYSILPDSTEMINIITRGKTTEDVVNEDTMQGHVRAKVNGHPIFL